MRPAVLGKMPAHGDFVVRGFSAPVAVAWDGWAGETIERDRSRHGERFDELFESAPPWRFVLASGGFSDGWSAGAFAPSIDAAGRRYILALALIDLEAGAALSVGLALAESVEAVLYDALAEQLTADEAISRMTDAVGPALQSSCAAFDAFTASASAGAWWTSNGACLRAAAPPASVLATAPVVEACDA